MTQRIDLHTFITASTALLNIKGMVLSLDSSHSIRRLEDGRYAVTNDEGNETLHHDAETAIRVWAKAIHAWDPEVSFIEQSPGHDLVFHSTTTIRRTP